MPSSNLEERPSPDLAFSVVVAAAGAGERMGGRRKPLLQIRGLPILYRALAILKSTPGCAEIIPVLHPEDYGNAELTVRLEEEFGITKVAAGGAARQQSVLAGLEAVSDNLDLVLIHDAVRPLVTADVVRRVAEAAAQSGAAIAAVPATETVKEVEPSGRIVATPPRERLWLARTPQGFRKELILRAHRAARGDGFCGTDDAQLVERLGHKAVVVEDRRDNLKITTAEDLALAEAILVWREGQSEGQ
jgi:2-C-methyl-D-erythritol 4-phosphate cytidylyltransferase